MLGRAMIGRHKLMVCAEIGHNRYRSLMKHAAAIAACQDLFAQDLFTLSAEADK
jgi:hypothetical protein